MKFRLQRPCGRADSTNYPVASRSMHEGGLQHGSSDVSGESFERCSSDTGGPAAPQCGRGMKMLKLTDYYDDQVLTWRQYYLLSDFYIKLWRESIGYTLGVRKPHVDDFTYFHPSAYTSSKSCYFHPILCVFLAISPTESWNLVECSIWNHKPLHKT